MPTSNLVLPLTAINHLPVDIRLVMFDMAGTTVNDTVDGMPLVTAAMIRAFKEAGITIKEEAMTPHRGKSKRDAVQALLEAHLDQVPDLKQKQQESPSTYQQSLSSHTSHIFSLFNKHLNTLLSSISSEIEGTTHVMRTLKSRGIKIGVGSGFSKEVVEKIVENMGWKKHGLIDYIGSADSTAKGRPDPGMILQCMSVCGITDPRQVVKVGDTQVDVEEGHNAKTWTVAVLTGTQSQSTLTKSRPDFILSSVALLPAILTSPSQLSSHVTRARIISRKSLTRQSTGSLTRQPTPDVVNDIDTEMFPRLTTRRYVTNDKIPSRL